MIMKEVDRWRVITGRQICSIAGFTGQRACDRRLHKLIEANYLQRQKILYGVPSLYSLAPLGKTLLGIPNRKEKFRVEQIAHDIAVVDTAIFFHEKYRVPYAKITTEKQLHRQDGFSHRKHRPDFVVTQKSKDFCVEIELSMKAKERFKQNVIDNFNNYYGQIWVVPDLQTNIYTFLADMKNSYPNIKIIPIAEVKSI